MPKNQWVWTFPLTELSRVSNSRQIQEWKIKKFFKHPDMGWKPWKTAREHTAFQTKHFIHTRTFQEKMLLEIIRHWAVVSFAGLFESLSNLQYKPPSWWAFINTLLDFFGCFVLVLVSFSQPKFQIYISSYLDFYLWPVVQWKHLKSIFTFKHLWECLCL